MDSKSILRLVSPPRTVGHSIVLAALGVLACGGSDGSSSGRSDGGNSAQDGGSAKDGSSKDGAGGGANPSEEAKHTYTDAEDWQTEVVDLINEYRAKGATCGDEKLGPVKPLLLDEELAPRLNKAAEHHVKDMAEEGITGHLDENGSGVIHRIWVENRDWDGNLGAGGATQGRRC